MAKIMALPKIGVNMTEATIIEWLVKEGDTVKKDDIIVTAETDKATQDINATESGVLIKILADAGETVQCQESIAIFGEPGENVTKAQIDNILKTNTSKTNFSQKLDDKTESQPQVGSGLPFSKRIKISPLAKKTAKALGIDYSQITPSEKGARITKKDVDSYAASLKAARQTEGIVVGDEEGTSIYSSRKPVFYELEIERSLPLNSIRKVITDRMSLSVNTIPRAILNVRVYAEKLLEWKEGCRQSGIKVGLTDIIVKAIAEAITKHPLINSRLREDMIEVIKNKNIGVAVDTERGLLVPVIHNADKKKITEIHEELHVKAENARRGAAATEDLTGGTFTVTNLGMYGIEQFIPVINPPECAILAVGAIIREPVAEESTDKLVVKPMFRLSLAFDHRIIDGGPAGNFLMDVKRNLEWPLSIII